MESGNAKASNRTLMRIILAFLDLTCIQIQQVPVPILLELEQNRNENCGIYIFSIMPFSSEADISMLFK
jgi:hypothetical protein